VPTWTGVAMSVLLVALTAGLAYYQRLGLTWPLLVASARAGVQLVAVGAVLLVLFRHAGLWGALGWVVVMVVIGGQVAGRHGHGLPLARMAASVGIATGTGLTLGALLALRIVATTPRVVIPVGGMIILGALQATGLALQRVRDDARQARPQIEARLCLGLSAREAFAPHQRSALRTALLPAIDSTKVVGLISLPGAMTGLILAGVDPLTAIRYQIVVMYMLLAATALAALVTTRLAERALFDDAQRLIPLTGTGTS
jgi:putative ABC transport system permease protein